MLAEPQSTDRARRAHRGRWGVAGIVVLAAAAAALVVMTRHEPRHVSTGAASLSDRDVMKIVGEGAATAGEPDLASISWVATTRGAATGLIGSGSYYDADHAVVPAQVSGTFGAGNAPRPPGAAAPTGTWLHYVIDSATGEVTGVGLVDAPLDLAKLGTVHTPK
jgi:hypothetical protein